MTQARTIDDPIRAEVITDTLTDAALDGLLRMMSPDIRRMWCDSPACACMGCANGTGGLKKFGVTRERWRCALQRIEPQRPSKVKKRRWKA